MTLTRYNPFTRWLLTALAILLLAVVLYLGRECAVSTKTTKQAATACEVDMTAGKAITSPACRKTTLMFSRRVLSRLATSPLARILEPQISLPTQSG